MNEGVQILEGGLTRRISPVDKIKINTTDGNSALYISDSQTTGVLHATENGIYIASEEGYDAYSEVIIRVFDDWDYETPDMDLDLWDLETIEDFELDPDGFDDVFNDPDEWTDIDKPIDLKLKTKNISGIDPVTGNDMEVGLNKDGTLEEKYLPSAIRVVVPPRKTSYHNGETIDFSGIHVYLFDANGNRFTSNKYPTGEIPFGELIFPVTIAEGTGVYEAGYPSFDISPFPNPLKFIYGNSYVPNSSLATELHFTGTEEKAITIFYCFKDYTGSELGNEYQGCYLYVIASKSQFYFIERADSGATHYTYNNNDIYFRSYYSMGYYEDSTLPRIMLNELDDTFAYPEKLMLAKIAYIMLYGDITDNKIPVQWIRSDNNILEDAFAIKIVSDSEEDDQEEQEDPYADDYDFIWAGRAYNLNREMVPSVSYSDGIIKIAGNDREYTVLEAEALYLAIYVKTL